NRIVAGHELRLGDVFTAWLAGALYALAVASAGFALSCTRPAWRLAVGAALLLGLGVAIGLAPGRLVTAD
ncbi:hypothetical protein, partial [Escherichia coli]|uniref:hypothetical protein n=1 Tax=Escherichia coli TaxID=562 RepID=UPI00256EF750